MNVSNEYMSVPQAAELLEYDPSHVRRLCSKGELGATKIGRNWLVRRDLVEAYKENPPKPGPKPKDD